MSGNIILLISFLIFKKLKPLLSSGLYQKQLVKVDRIWLVG